MQDPRAHRHHLKCPAIRLMSCPCINNGVPHAHNVLLRSKVCCWPVMALNGHLVNTATFLRDSFEQLISLTPLQRPEQHKYSHHMPCWLQDYVIGSARAGLRAPQWPETGSALMLCTSAGPHRTQAPPGVSYHSFHEVSVHQQWCCLR